MLLRAEVGTNMRLLGRDFGTSHGRLAALVTDHPAEQGVVFLHGNSACKELFVHQLNLCQRERIAALAIDLPGHGASERAAHPQQTYSLPGYAEAIREVIAATGWTAIHLVGWSLGGHIALELLALEPKTSSAMIVGTPPIAMSASGVQEAFLPSPTMDLAFKPSFTREEALAYTNGMLGQDVVLPEGFVDVVLTTDGMARHWLAVNGMSGKGQDEKLVVETVRKPLAVVHGLRDPFVNYEYLRSLRYSCLWRDQVMTLDAGHAPHFEQPTVFNPLLLSFLKETGLQ